MGSYNITLRKLEIFLTYMNTQSMTRTAERLDLSSVAVHRALHSLEENLHCRLFYFEGRRLKPLKTAVILAQYAEPIITQFNVALNSIQELTDNTKQVLKIGTLYSLTYQYTPTVIAGLQNRRPNMHIDQTVGSNRRLLDMLEMQTLDAILILTPDNYDEKRYLTIPLFQDKAFLAVPPDSPYAKQKQVDLCELKDEKFITLTDGFATFKEAMEVFRIAGFTPNTIMRVHDIFSVAGLVNAKAGYSLLPGRIYSLFPDLCFVPIRQATKIMQTISLILPAHRETEPGLLALAAECRMSAYKLFGRAFATAKVSGTQKAYSVSPTPYTCIK